MDSDLSRQVAEAMGLPLCPSSDKRRGSGYHAGTCTRPAAWPCTAPYLDLADARDREEAIAFLNAKGWVVSITHAPDSHTVIIWADTGPSTKGGQGWPTIEEAFGRAFLGAVGAQG